MLWGDENITLHQTQKFIILAIAECCTRLAVYVRWQLVITNFVPFHFLYEWHMCYPSHVIISELLVCWPIITWRPVWPLERLLGGYGHEAEGGHWSVVTYPLCKPSMKVSEKGFLWLRYKPCNMIIYSPRLPVMILSLLSAQTLLMQQAHFLLNVILVISKIMFL
jgi:hypothetical protein